MASVPRVTTFRGEAGPQGVRVPVDGSARLPSGAPSWEPAAGTAQWPERVHRVRSCHAPGRAEGQRQVLLAGVAGQLPLTRLPEAGWVCGRLESGKFWGFNGESKELEEIELRAVRREGPWPQEGRLCSLHGLPGAE